MITTNNIFVRFGLCLLSAGLLSLGWYDLHLSWLTLFAFIPILALCENLIAENKKHSKAKFFGYVYLTFVVWNTITTWWVYYASPAGVFAAILISSLLMALVMLLSFVLWKSAGRKIGLIAFVANYLAFEYLFMNSEIAWPWLVLGNAFANDVQIVQWYEFTGHLGGSLWILLINVLTYLLISKLIEQKRNFQNSTSSRKAIIPIIISLAFFIVVPISYSLIRYYTYNETAHPQKVVVIQPNIDPYNEKFDETRFASQIDNILDLAHAYSDSTTAYFIAPETALNGTIQEDYPQGNFSLCKVQQFMKNYPQAKFVIGASTFKVYYGKHGNKAFDGTTVTRTARELCDDHYDIYNVSMQIDSQPEVQIYHKSRLVPGAELLPYIEVFGFLSDLMTDLGGMSGSHGRQERPTSFSNDVSGVKVGVPVCYESAFGEHVANFVNAGANMIFVITNDGWWHDTPGYRQHCSYSRLRAIETRRSIARSANTGISCIINQRGEVEQQIGWWQRGAISASINANDKITFYTKYGDYLARMAAFVAGILIVIAVVARFRKKSSK